jgi:hypothetical protein
MYIPDRDIETAYVISFIPRKKRNSPRRRQFNSSSINIINYAIKYILIQLERVVSPNPAVDTVKSNDSDKTLSGSSDSIGTAYRLDSQDSTTSVEGISPTLMTFQPERWRI